MANLNISYGFRRMTGDLVDAAVLGLLVRRALDFGNSEKGRMKLSTLANEVCRNDQEVIAILHRLRDRGFVRICEGEGLEPGSLIGIRQVSIDFGVFQGALDLDGEDEVDEDRPYYPAVPKYKNRLETFEDDQRRGNLRIFGTVVPVYVSDSSADILSCSLTITEQDSDGLRRIAVESMDFDTPAEAWAYFDEFVGPEGVLDWLFEVRQAHRGEEPILLEPASFEAACSAFIDEKPDNVDRKIACNTGLAKGLLVIGFPSGAVKFKRDDSGLAFPGLLPGLAEDAEPAEEEDHEEGEGLSREEFTINLEDGSEVAVRYAANGTATARFDFEGPLSEAGTYVVTVKKADIDSPYNKAVDLAEEQRARFLQAVGQ